MFYSTANPHVSSTACVNLSYISWCVPYGGKSMRLKHVWAFGKFCVGTSAVRWMVNNRGPTAPVDPCSARNPCNGTRDEPVTNCSNRARISDVYDSTICVDGIEMVKFCCFFFSSPTEYVSIVGAYLTCQNHCTCRESTVQCFKRVCVFQSFTSMLLMPPITSSNSRSSNGRSSWLGINSQKPMEFKWFRCYAYKLQKISLFFVPHTPFCKAKNCCSMPRMNR